MRALSFATLVPVVLVVTMGCGEKPPPTQAKASEAKVDGAAMLLDVEQRLLTSTGGLRIVVDSDATGAVEAHMKTTLTLAPTDKVRLESEGTFGPDAMKLVLVSDGLVMRRVRNGEQSEAVPSTGLRRQMLTELVRMGLLHDVAELAGGEYPTHLVDYDTWVVAHDPQVGDIDPTFEPPARPIAFLVRVSGQETGDCALHVDKTMRPVQRLQVVHFPKGDMRVKESYAFESVPPDVDYAKP